MPKYVRHTYVSRDVTAGCHDCGASWSGPAAQGTAARHHDAKGHETWADVVMSVRYTCEVKKAAARE